MIGFPLVYFSPDNTLILHGYNALRYISLSQIPKKMPKGCFFNCYRSLLFILQNERHLTFPELMIYSGKLGGTNHAVEIFSFHCNGSLSMSFFIISNKA